MSSEYDPATNRRRFLQYLASSPLLAAGGASAFAETLLPKAMVPDPLMWGPRQSDHLFNGPDVIGVPASLFSTIQRAIFRECRSSP